VSAQEGCVVSSSILLLLNVGVVAVLSTATTLRDDTAARVVFDMRREAEVFFNAYLC
jgi:hypothetical protein